MIDAYFDFKFGRLPYRSLTFEHEHYTNKDLEEASRKRGIVSEPAAHKNLKLQPCVQINYAGDEPYTRTVEAKHITGQQIEGSTIIREFPADYSENTEPYYPVPNSDSHKLYNLYKTEAKKLKNVFFLGRLGTYKYYNMDQVVASALTFTKRFHPTPPKDT